MELQELTRKRLEHIRSCRENNDKSHEIIAGLYSDPSHFVYELLQNADDAKASEVVFKLTRDSIQFSHNGKKLFNHDDVESITTVGSSAKKDDINAIGKFGAGFKSVFGVTTSPIIHSGEYHFEIVDFIVPKEIDAIDSSENTIIILPFNHKILSIEKAYQQIAKKLETLEAESLLFLRNIREIQWSTEEDAGHYLSEVNGEKACIISQRNNEDRLDNYLLFTKKIRIENEELRLAVAYALDGPNIKPIHDTELFVFFPTNERTGLNFIVHAPYKTTPSRESIPFSDDQNEILTDKLSSLIADSIISIKKRGYLNVDFLTMLPIDKSEKHPIYIDSFQQVKNIMLSENILPTPNGSFTNATDAVLAKEKELVSLLNANDCAELFGKPNWLDSNITYNKTRELRNYLITELSIPEVDMTLFCTSITENFIQPKSDEWLIHFYSSITTNDALYRKGTNPQQKGVLREKPIIRLEDGAHICPENESGELQVYLPAEQDSGFDTVKRSIARDERAMKFLVDLGLKQPDRVAEIKEFIVPKYKDKKAATAKESYLKDFIKSFQIWSDSNEYKKQEIIDILKGVYFCGGVNSEGTFVTEKPERVYVKTERLESWFAGNKTDGVVFLAIELKEREYKDFIEKLGVKNSLKIVAGVDKETSYNDPRYFQRKDGYNPYLSIDGLEYSLAHINLNRSIFLWGLLLRDNPNRLFGYTKEKRILKDELQTGERENSKVLRSLEGKQWLYDKSSSLFSEISIEDLHDDYTKEHDNINKLIEALGLKLDKVKQFEKENPDLVVISRAEFEQYKQNKAETEKGDLPDSEWSPEANLEDVNIVVDTTPIENIESGDLSGQRTVDNSSEEDTDVEESSNNGSDRNPPKTKHAKEIGYRGEEHAKEYLEEKYPEKSVVWLNANGNAGKGYDFVVREDDVDIAYYEVKSKVDESPTEFEVTGAQWNWARKLHSKGKGDMYCILLVKGVGTKDVVIKPYPDPISLWKAGKIHARPVNIKL